MNEYFSDYSREELAAIRARIEPKIHKIMNKCPKDIYYTISNGDDYLVEFLSVFNGGFAMARAQVRDESNKIYGFNFFKINRETIIN